MTNESSPIYVDNFLEGDDECGFSEFSPPSLLDWELSKLRECTKEALRMSWAEAERLQGENAAFEKRADELRYQIKMLEGGEFKKLPRQDKRELFQKGIEADISSSSCMELSPSDDECHDGDSSHVLPNESHSLSARANFDTNFMQLNALDRRHSDSKIMERRVNVQHPSNKSVKNLTKTLRRISLVGELLYEYDCEELSIDNDDLDPDIVNKVETESELMDTLAELEQSTKTETQELEKQIAERERGIVALEETAKSQEEYVDKLRKEFEISTCQSEQESKAMEEDLDVLCAHIEELQTCNKKLDMHLLKQTNNSQGNGTFDNSKNQVLISAPKTANNTTIKNYAPSLNELLHLDKTAGLAPDKTATLGIYDSRIPDDVSEITFDQSIRYEACVK